MRILLFGKNGQVGWELQRTLAPLGEVVSLGRAEADLSQPGGPRQAVRQTHPQVIVNAAAFTDVDRAESESGLAMTVNGSAPGVLAEEAKALKALFIHYSTDYVFDGMKGTPYTEEDVPNPINMYGRSKLAGEQAIRSAGGAYLILRTAWVYSARRDSFVTKVLQWARQNETLRIVDDQISNPTWARMLAAVTGLLLARGVEYVKERKGLYHLAGSGFASRFEWAKQIVKLDPNRHEQKVKEILPAPTSEFPTPAQRPLFSALTCELFSQTFGIEMLMWQDALMLAIDK